MQILSNTITLCCCIASLYMINIGMVALPPHKRAPLETKSVPVGNTVPIENLIDTS